MRVAASLAFAAAALFGTAAQAQVNVKIGVMNDMSGLYADISGPGAVTAAKMAVEDFNPAAHGMKVDIIAADHQNKTDIGVGIARRAPHPNAALLFYDFMLTREAQQLLLSMDYIPTESTVPSPLARRRFTLVDPALALDQHDKWARSFEDVIIKRSAP